MWATWMQRFTELERSAAAGQAQERAMWAGLPMRPDPILAKQVGDRFVQPWSSLHQTFGLASTAAGLPSAVSADYQAYLGLRVAYYQAVVRRCLNPTPTTQAQLVEHERRIDTFVGARRRSSTVGDGQVNRPG
ncbi:MAG TPA: hypothetical protein DCS97_14965 [Planctomycetes bacterium]|nr:hypothetical protein [Planctomycetota bacterium]